MKMNKRAYDKCQEGTSALVSGENAIRMTDAGYRVLKKTETWSQSDMESFTGTIPVYVELTPGTRIEVGIGEGG